jgi:hypothetical protein
MSCLFRSYELSTEPSVDWWYHASRNGGLSIQMKKPASVVVGGVVASLMPKASVGLVAGPASCPGQSAWPAWLLDVNINIYGFKQGKSIPTKPHAS